MVKFMNTEITLRPISSHIYYVLEVSGVGEHPEKFTESQMTTLKMK